MILNDKERFKTVGLTLAQLFERMASCSTELRVLDGLVSTLAASLTHEEYAEVQGQNPVVARLFNQAVAAFKLREFENAGNLYAVSLVRFFDLGSWTKEVTAGALAEQKNCDAKGSTCIK